MKRIGNRLYLKAVMLMVFMMFVPLQVSAAEQDQVILHQDGSEVSVSLNMSDAEEENITAVSVSLKVDAGGYGLAEVDFEFSSELSSAECGFRYSKNSDDTGRLDIYAVTGSGQSLFREGTLNLGNVKVTPNTSTEVLAVEISYCEGSFQTANAAYGDKTPMVEYSESALLQLGGGDPAGDGTPGNDGSGNSNPGNGNSGNDGQSAALPDMNESLGTSTSIKVKPAGSGTSKPIGNGNVTVVAPEDGMSSIIISKEDSDSSDTEEEETGKNVEEIFLDQENGGVAGTHKEENKSGMLLVFVIVVIIVVLLGLGVLLFMKKREQRTVRK